MDQRAIEARRAYFRKYKVRNKEKLKQQNWEERQRLKREVVDAYGEKCPCGYSDIRALCIDHIQGGGCEELRLKTGSELYRWLRKNQYPEGFQTLCCNCNLIKAIDGKELHGKEWYLKENSDSKSNYFTDRHLLIKAQVMSAYGSKCNCGCTNLKALCIDHVIGGGDDHRKEIGGNIHNWLVKNNFPAGFQILCANCNAIKALECGELGRNQYSGDRS